MQYEILPVGKHYRRKPCYNRKGIGSTHFCYFQGLSNASRDNFGINRWSSPFRPVVTLLLHKHIPHSVYGFRSLPFAVERQEFLGNES